MRDTRRTRIVLVVLLVVALALIVLNYRDGKSSLLHDARDAAASAFGGAEHAASSVGRFFAGSGSSASQVTKLRREVLQLRAELSGERLTKVEYHQLHRLLLVAGAGGYRVVAATVIALGQGFQQAVTLDVGSSSGVRADETVINGEGLVGQVVSVTPSTCTVLLASDSSSVVGVQLAPSGELGYVTGAGKSDGGDGPMQLQMLNSSAVVKPGDQLVTAASKGDRPYVPGVPVGTVTRLINRNGALTAVAEVRPFVDFTALGVVGVVIAPPDHNPRFSVLPPLPRPAATITVTITATPGARRSSSPTPSPGG